MRTTKTGTNQNRYFSLFTGKIVRRLYGANACDKHNAQSYVPLQMYLFLREYTSLTSRKGGEEATGGEGVVKVRDDGGGEGTQ